MKNLVKIVLLFISFSSFGQRVLPANVNNELLSKIKKEGRLKIINAWSALSATRTTTTAGTSITGSVSSFTTVGKHTFIENIMITSDRSIVVGLVVKQASWDATGQSLFFTTGSTSTTTSNTVVIPVNILVRDGGQFSLFIQQNDTGETAEASGTFIVYEVTADINFEAQKTVLLCGDSTTWGTMGVDATSIPFDGQHLYGFQVRDKIMDSTRATVRLVNKGFGGSSSPDWKKAIRSGEIDGIDYDLMIVSLGLNDAGAISGSYTIQNFKDNLKLFAKHRDRYRKNASILFLAPSPTDKTSWMAQIANIRTAVSEVVTELGGSGSKVYFVNQNNAFTLNATASADVNICSDERSAGNRVHPSGLGHTAIAEYIWSVSKTWMYNNLR